MDKKTTGIIGLVVATLFCGLPGLCGLCIGPFFAVAGAIPGAEIDVFGSSSPSAAIGTGIATFCVSVLFVAIPVLVWYFVVREKPAEADEFGKVESLPDDM